MNVKSVTIIIFVLIVLTGFGIFFMNEQNTKQLAQRISPTSTETTRPELTALNPGGRSVTSNDERVTFSYPTSWYLQDTTERAEPGKFGPIVQSWALRNFPFAEGPQNSISENTAVIDINIEHGGTNHPIDDLVDCGMKTTECEKIGIDNEQFIRSEQTLNTGMKSITIATFYDDKILRMHALIAPGEQEAALTETVNEVMRSIRFSEISSGNN